MLFKYRNILQQLEDPESKSRDPIYLYAVLAFAASMLKVHALSKLSGTTPYRDISRPSQTSNIFGTAEGTFHAACAMHCPVSRGV